MNVDLAGKTYPPIPYEVGREKIREFATAVGETDRVYHDVDAAKEAGYAEQIAPATFATVLHLRAIPAVLTDPDLQLDYSRVVHGEQRFEHVRPIHAGDELQVVVTVESIMAKAGNDIVTTKAELTTTGGELVSTAHSTIVARGTAA